MSILVVEDDGFKKDKIGKYLASSYPECRIDYALSVSSAKKAIKRGEYKVILMDMSLPTFDVTHEDAGGRPHAFGGRELLSYMKYKEISTPVVIVTQFERFQSEEGDMDVRALRKYLSREFSGFYKALVSFSHLDESWHSEMKRFLESYLK